MNPVTAFSWAWKALRGHSVVFAALLGAALLGLSVLHWVRTSLGALGAPWFAVLLVPIFAVAILARKESEWLPDIEQRKRWARGLIVGALFLAALIQIVERSGIFGEPVDPDESGINSTAPSPIRPRGPSGK